jgi:Cu-Zn family superoxide dismutase
MTLTARRLIAPMLFAAVAVACGQGLPQESTPLAKAELRAADGTDVGNVEFFDQAGATMVRVRLDVKGKADVGKFHGIHIHANDDPANGSGCVADPNADPTTWFVSADGHLRTDDQLHPDHIGDFPSVLIKQDGTASLEFVTDRLTSGDLVGHAVILHANADNFGNIPSEGPQGYTANGPDAITQTDRTGNAGNRIACSVIE